MKTLTIKTFAFCSLVALASCGDSSAESNEVEISMNFSAVVGGKDADCNTDYVVGTKDTTAKLADARFFISNIELKSSDGTWESVALNTNDWQYNDVALLDFEDGKDACKDSGTPEMNKSIIATVRSGTYTDLRFSLGVPFELNHIDNATAPAPLNTPGMFWVWQGGYKFARVDWLVTGGEVPRFNTHLGSTGCESAAKTTPPQARCKNPNMPTFELPISDFKNISVAFDLETLIAKTDMSANTIDSPPGCMSSPMDGSDCEGIFDTLGMSFTSGTCEDNCSGQTAFTAAN